MGPQAGGASFVLGEAARRRPKGPVRIEDPIGEPLEEVGLVRFDAKVVELDLRLSPGEGGCALERAGLTELVGQIQDVVPGLRDDCRERHAGGRARREPNAAAKAEDRIEYGADRVRKRPTVEDRNRRSDRPAAAEEAGAVCFVLDD